jgi:hypothetical protein
MTLAERHWTSILFGTLWFVIEFVLDRPIAEIWWHWPVSIASLVFLLDFFDRIQRRQHS